MANLSWSRLQRVSNSAVALYGLGNPVIVAISLAIFLGSVSQASDPFEPLTYYVAGPRFEVSTDLWKLGQNETATMMEGSLDQGLTWYPISQTDGLDLQRTRTSGFQAQADGRYLFRLLGSIHGRLVLHEAIAIVTDTKRPEASLAVGTSDIGQYIVRFVAKDENLNVDSLRVEYRTSDSDPWIQSKVELFFSDLHCAWYGECLLGIAQQQGIPRVRLSVKDRAGNAFEIIRLAKIDAESQSQGSKILAGFSKSIQPPAADYSRDSVPHQTGLKPPRQTTDGDASSIAGYSNSMRYDPTARRAIRDSVAINRFHTSSKHFELDYELESDLFGAKALELWATMDEGQSWTRWGATDSITEPLQIEVEHEGLFGFRLCPISKGMTSMKTPSPGDHPDVWVIVD